MVRNGYKQTEAGEIPEDWDSSPLGEVSVSVSSGTSGTKSTGLDYPIYGSTGLIGSSCSYDYSGRKILVARVGANAGRVNKVAGKYCVSDNTLIVDLEKKHSIEYFFYQSVYRNLNQLVFGSGQPLITGGQLKALHFPVPRAEFEQQKIGKVLSDVDELIISLEKLVAKKRDIKKAAMQQLLTGKKRLPDFGEGKGNKQTELGEIPEDWDIRPLGELLRIRHGKSQKGVLNSNGDYPILATGGEIGRAHTPLFSKPSVLIGRKGTIDRPYYMGTPFWSVDTLFYSEISENADAKFLYYKFLFIDWYQYNEASGVPSLSSRTVEKIEQAVPLEKDEQVAISKVLSDFDREIDSLSGRLQKTKAIKLGMMQELLTGRTRLVDVNAMTELQEERMHGT